MSHFLTAVFGGMVGGSIIVILIVLDDKRCNPHLYKVSWRDAFDYHWERVADRIMGRCTVCHRQRHKADCPLRGFHD